VVRYSEALKELQYYLWKHHLYGLFCLVIFIADHNLPVCVHIGHKVGPNVVLPDIHTIQLIEIEKAGVLGPDYSWHGYVSKFHKVIHMEREKYVDALELLIPLEQCLKVLQELDRLLMLNVTVIECAACVPRFLTNFNTLQKGQIAQGACELHNNLGVHVTV
jgi:hypothetical protein